MDKARWNRIEELYTSVSELPEFERVKHLAVRCDGDEDLFNEVVSLLESSGESNGFLSEGGFEIGLKILADPGQVLEAGQQFGHFTISDLLGRGGMGEVYLAEDSRLKRRVALKVLPSGFGADEEGIRRLIREAKMASVLNHPNILTIYDVGEIEGRNFIASEYVEGLTLRQLLRTNSPLPFNKAVQIFAQISAALAAAHGAGIIHRDIKPENVMIREDGLVKVLDFGLAKLVPGLEAISRPDEPEATNPGIILGTVSYMSPEQVRGKKTDERSDIWSLGVVLGEMLTGSLPFSGETASDKIAAILKSEPELPFRDAAGIPVHVRRVIEKALEKSPDNRYRSVAKMSEDFELASQSHAGPTRNGPSSSTDYLPVAKTEKASVNVSTEEITGRTDRRRFSAKTVILSAAIGAMMIGGIAAAAYFFSPQFSQDKRMTKVRVVGSGNSVSAAISPDGRFVAHVVAQRGTRSLQLKDLTTGAESVLLKPDPFGPGGLTFSKDGKSIYYLRDQDPAVLYRLPIAGGEPEKIAERVDSAISFSPDGQSFAFIRQLREDVNSLVVRSADGSERQIAVREGKTRFGTGGVAWSPDGGSVASAVNEVRGMSVVDIAVYPVDGGEPRLIAPANWREIQRLVWMPDGSGIVAPALERKGENYVQLWFFPVNGRPAEAVTDELIEHADVSLTNDGKKLVTVQWQNRINIWKIPGGKSELAAPISNSIHARYRAIALAPDGKIVFPSNEDSEGNRDIWIMNADGTGARRLTSKQGNNLLPCVAKDGKYIIVSSNRADRNSYHIWRMNIDGSDPRQLTFGKSERGPLCPPDPSMVYFHTGGPADGMQVGRIGRVSINGGKIEILTDYPTTRSDISPDGKHIVSVCKPDPKSPFKIGIIPIDGGKPIKTFELKQVSYLRWRPDGHAITFTRSFEDVSNFWEQPVDGGPQRQLTNFAAETIINFAWAASGDLFCSRGYEINDPIILTNFR